MGQNVFVDNIGLRIADRQPVQLIPGRVHHCTRLANARTWDVWWPGIYRIGSASTDVRGTSYLSATRLVQTRLKWRSYMAKRNRKHSRRVPVISGVVAVISLVGGVLGNIVAADIQESALTNYRPWVWGVFIIASLIGIGWFIRESVQSNEDGVDSFRLSDVNREITELRSRYLKRIIGDFQYLPLRGVDFKTASADTGEDERLHLADVYIQLNTTAKQQLRGEKSDGTIRAQPDELFRHSNDEVQPLSVLTALAENRHMVLLGDPGGGKSTFVNHVAFCLANHQL